MNVCGSDVNLAMSCKCIQSVILLMTKWDKDKLHHEWMDEICVHFKKGTVFQMSMSKYFFTFVGFNVIDLMLCHYHHHVNVLVSAT